jgi:hypothetical protein
MDIDLNLLKKAVERAIDDFSALHGRSAVNLDNALYWVILDNDLYNMSEKPGDLGVGDLEEEYAGIVHRLRENERLGSVELQHLAGILSWLSTKEGAA